MFLTKGNKYSKLTKPYYTKGGKFVGLKDVAYLTKDGKFVKLAGDGSTVYAAYACYHGSPRTAFTLIYKSDDNGNTWSFHVKIDNVNFTDMTYANGKLYAICVNTGIYSSSDGKTWTCVKSIANKLSAICYNTYKKQLVAIGECGSYSIESYTSEDGINWTATSIGSGTTSSSRSQRILFTKDYYVFVAERYCFWYSADGITWQRAYRTNDSYHHYYCAIYDGTKTMLVRAIINSDYYNMYLDYFTTDPTALTSKQLGDFTNWSSSGLSFNTPDAVYGNKYVIQAFLNFTSEDGATWENHSYNMNHRYDVGKMQYIDGKYHMISPYAKSVVNNATYTYYPCMIHYYSEDGKTWTQKEILYEEYHTSDYIYWLSTACLCVSTDGGGAFIAE